MGRSRPGVRPQGLWTPGEDGGRSPVFQAPVGRAPRGAGAAGGPPGREQHAERHAGRQEPVGGRRGPAVRGIWTAATWPEP
jgi:hypothetical protein